MLRVLLSVMAVCGVSHATSCARLAPCASIGPQSVLFIGTVTGVEELTGRDPYEGARARVTLRVREIFQGLSDGAKDVTIEAGRWMVRGKDYLVDARRSESGSLSLGICGQSDEVDESSEFLRYLRARKKGGQPTSLMVLVASRAVTASLGIEGAEVLARGPKGDFRARTDRDGRGIINRIPAGKYTIHVSRPGYRQDEQASEEPTVEVLDQTCRSTYAYLWSQSSVAGTLRMTDGKEAPGVPVELVQVDPERGRKGFSPAVYHGRTGPDGAFEFENVFPGRYLLGTNIMSDNYPTGNIQRAYFPGRSSRDEAAEIQVGESAQVGGLQFTLPDSGPRRTIRICVVDEKGSPVKGARIGDGRFGKRDVRFGNLGDELVTDEKGCVVTQGYERASYQVGSSVGPDIRNLRASAPVDIPPGKGPTTVLLVVRPLKR